jgi:hypothetical protein
MPLLRAKVLACGRAGGLGRIVVAIALALIGAFGFGLVLGWFTYFSNRHHRSNQASLVGLASLAGIVAAGAIMSLFGELRSELLGAYGIGLAIGFFAYFAMLLVLVEKSKGVFTVTWFLDGRRKKLAPDEELSSDMGPAALNGKAAAPEPAQAWAGTDGAGDPRVPVEQSDRALMALLSVQRDIANRVGNASDTAERQWLSLISDELDRKLDQLTAARLGNISKSEPIQAGVVKLTAVTSTLEGETRRARLESVEDPSQGSTERSA